MLPPIKRATRNADDIFKDRATTTSILLWKHVSNRGGKKPVRFAPATFDRAKKEVMILDCVAEKPGSSAKEIAEKIGFAAPSIAAILASYREDGIVRSSKTFPPRWYLVNG